MLPSKMPLTSLIRFRLLHFGITFLVCASIILSASTAYAEKGRQKVIDFEDDVIEGMNKRPLDSLSQISERNKKRRKPHLYRKRVGFRSETIETVKEMRYTQ